MRTLLGFGLAMAAVLLGTDPLLAQAAQTVGPVTYSPGFLGAGIGAGLAGIGGGIGLGLIGYSALASMARQPEYANKLQVTMLIVAALVEAPVFFGLIICILLAFKA